MSLETHLALSCVDKLGCIHKRVYKQCIVRLLSFHPHSPCQAGWPLTWTILHAGVGNHGSSVQSLSRVRLSATPWIAALRASLSITNSRSSLRLMSIESVMPSSHLILCRPVLLLPPIPPSIRVFSNESTLRNQGRQPQNVPQWHLGYFEFKLLKKWTMQDGNPTLCFFVLPTPHKCIASWSKKYKN